MPGFLCIEPRLMHTDPIVSFGFSFNLKREKPINPLIKFEEKMVRMGLDEIAIHSWYVIIGQRKSQMSEYAQPIGPKDGYEFLNGFLIISVCVGIMSTILRSFGGLLGRALGLKTWRTAKRFSGKQFDLLLLNP